MSWHKFSDYLNKLKLGELTPIIAVYGSDRFLRKQVIDAVSKKLGEGKHLDQESFYGSESGPTGILAACQTYSMFTQLKLVLVHQFQSLVAAQRTQLMTYLDNPNPTVELILLADPPEEHFEEKRFKEWFTGASKKIDVVDVSGVSDKEISALFKQMVKDFGKRIEPEAEQLLLNAIGPEPGRIYLEMEKICLYLGEVKLISAELVSDLVIGSRPQNIFELAESLGKKDIERSLTLYRKMLEQKQPREMMLSVIKRHYRILLELRASLGSEQMTGEVMARFRIPRNFFPPYQQQAERFQEKDLKRVFEEFYQTELSLKSSSLEEEAVMERLIFRLCRI